MMGIFIEFGWVYGEEGKTEVWYLLLGRVPVGGTFLPNGTLKILENYPYNKELYVCPINKAIP